jgi:methylmalonyl-CoA/ethylmalonyl-CoA epimerase
VTPLRRLDHVAIVVESSDRALEYFSGTLGLEVAASEVLETPAVRLVYLDAGNVFLQLIEPLDSSSEIASWLAEHGEGVHHICFAVDRVPEAIEQLSGEQPASVGTGRGRRSAFLPGPAQHGVLLECTEFDFASDVERTPGWLDGGDDRS